MSLTVDGNNRADLTGGIQEQPKVKKNNINNFFFKIFHPNKAKESQAAKDNKEIKAANDTEFNYDGTDGNKLRAALGMPLAPEQTSSAPSNGNNTDISRLEQAANEAQNALTTKQGEAEPLKSDYEAKLGSANDAKTTWTNLQDKADSLEAKVGDEPKAPGDDADDKAKEDYKKEKEAWVSRKKEADEAQHAADEAKVKYDKLQEQADKAKGVYDNVQNEVTELQSKAQTAQSELEAAKNQGGENQTSSIADNPSSNVNQQQQVWQGPEATNEEIDKANEHDNEIIQNAEDQYGPSCQNMFLNGDFANSGLTTKQLEEFNSGGYMHPSADDPDGKKLEASLKKMGLDDSQVKIYRDATKANDDIYSRNQWRQNNANKAFDMSKSEYNPADKFKDMSDKEISNSINKDIKKVDDMQKSISDMENQLKDPSLNAMDKKRLQSAINYQKQQYNEAKAHLEADEDAFIKKSGSSNNKNVNNTQNPTDNNTNVNAPKKGEGANKTRNEKYVPDDTGNSANKTNAPKPGEDVNKTRNEKYVPDDTGNSTNKTNANNSAKLNDIPYGKVTGDRNNLELDLSNNDI
ncbi:hypothetical protein IJ843_05550 [bacterium]|nr:hypothetical protein [bacterium]